MAKLKAGDRVRARFTKDQDPVPGTVVEVAHGTAHVAWDDGSCSLSRPVGALKKIPTEPEQSVPKVIPLTELNEFF